MYSDILLSIAHFGSRKSHEDCVRSQWHLETLHVPRRHKVAECMCVCVCRVCVRFLPGAEDVAVVAAATARPSHRAVAPKREDPRSARSNPRADHRKAREADDKRESAKKNKEQNKTKHKQRKRHKKTEKRKAIVRRRSTKTFLYPIQSSPSQHRTHGNKKPPPPTPSPFPSLRPPPS